MHEASLSERIERALAQIGVFAAVTEREGVIWLDGQVDTSGDRAAAEDLARDLAGERRIENNLEVELVLPQTAGALNSDAPSESDLPDSVGELAALDESLEPDFTDQEILTDPLAAAGPASSLEDPVQEGDEAYVPPTDPVVTVDRHGRAEVLGGFAFSADQDIGVPRSASDGRLGDEAIADAIRRELREDAATTDLEVEPIVEQGVVRLRGRVPLLDDAENAEAVAARVPGVVEVIEELEVASV